MLLKTIWKFPLFYLLGIALISLIQFTIILFSVELFSRYFVLLVLKFKIELGPSPKPWSGVVKESIAKESESVAGNCGEAMAESPDEWTMGSETKLKAIVKRIITKLGRRL